MPWNLRAEKQEGTNLALKHSKFKTLAAKLKNLDLKPKKSIATTEKSVLKLEKGFGIGFGEVKPEAVTRELIHTELGLVLGGFKAEAVTWEFIQKGD